MGSKPTGRRPLSFLRAVSVRLGRWRQRVTFHGSGTYWERRYQAGGSSGVGSYGELAGFKAEILNGLIHENGIRSVIEFGCGDGAQLAMLDCPEYLGLDISATVLDRCRERFAGDATKRFCLYTPDFPRDVPAAAASASGMSRNGSGPAGNAPGAARADLSLSLDVLYHLVEEEVFARHLRDLFDAAERMVVVYSSDFDRVEPVPHVRHRKFTAWVEAHIPGWTLQRRIPNRYPYREEDGSGSLADFFVYERESR
jgi:hypothetical protein